jgi:hypothetical protein
MCLTPCAGGKDRRALGAGRDPSHLPAIHAAPARHSTRQSRAGLVTRKLWRQGTGSAVSPSVATRAPVRARNASRSTTSNSKRSSGTFFAALNRNGGQRGIDNLLHLTHAQVITVDPDTAADPALAQPNAQLAALAHRPSTYARCFPTAPAG